MRTSFCGRIRDKIEAAVDDRWYANPKAWKFPRIPKYIRQTLKVARMLVPLIPDKEDTVFGQIIKGVGVVDALHEEFVSGHNEFADYCTEHNLHRSSDRHIVSILMLSKLHEVETTWREIRIYGIEYSTTTTEVVNESGRAVILSNPHGTGDLFCSPGFDTSLLLSKLWAAYGQSMTMSTRYHQGYEMVTFGTFSEPKEPILGEALVRFENFVSQHKKYRGNTRSKIYLFHGEPGTGKSSLAQRLAMQTSDRVLLLDATSLDRWSCDDLCHFLGTMGPDFLILNDIDRSLGMYILLPLLERLKREIPTLSVAITVNDVNKLDKALFRPGRIDTAVLFPPPSDKDRRKVIEGYLKTTHHHLSDAVIQKMVQVTDGMSHDYLRELVLRLDYEDPDIAMEAMTDLWELSHGKKVIQATPTNGVTNGVNGTHQELTKQL